MQWEYNVQVDGRAAGIGSIPLHFRGSTVFFMALYEGRYSLLSLVSSGTILFDGFFSLSRLLSGNSPGGQVDCFAGDEHGFLFGLLNILCLTMG